MRTIKFRGKTKDGEWVFGFYFESNKTHFIYNTSMNWVDGIKEVILETVGQFTGLLDKNGKEIYEGDMFQTSSGFCYSVVFQRGAFGYLVHDDIDGRFVSFAENFANLKGKGNQLNGVEVLDVQ